MGRLFGDVAGPALSPKNSDETPVRTAPAGGVKAGDPVIRRMKKTLLKFLAQNCILLIVVDLTPKSLALMTTREIQSEHYYFRLLLLLSPLLIVVVIF